MLLDRLFCGVVGLGQIGIVATALAALWVNANVQKHHTFDDSDNIVMAIVFSVLGAGGARLLVVAVIGG